MTGRRPEGDTVCIRITCSPASPAADAGRGTEIFRGMTTDPHLTELQIEEYDVLDAPTTMTARD